MKNCRCQLKKCTKEKKCEPGTQCFKISLESIPAKCVQTTEMDQVPGWEGRLTWPHQNPLPTVLTSWKPQAHSQSPLHLAGTH